MENMKLLEIEEQIIAECVDLFIETFTKEPWNDVYESRDQVVEFLNNFLKNNNFLGYVAIVNKKIVALSIGMKKPWIKGIEYYIDQFCVCYELQGQGIGSDFLKEIEEDIKKQGLNGIILNTEKGYPSEKFYLKNGFKTIDELIVLAK
ncbi:GNAT family N-acetyltransferase [Clostridium sp. SHJSY1]|uniref:GNAT family N-acetyltransferase n=1 Tax=Clostridium sp. SHJSY1 TaxID=2942483 RepID=UPI0028771792|nr:GNAT family N-acetyltransferase [Clostridium sp. SHJSY1]MDS0524326.1 GNAT family N-acetyltransferase [Clostridium sp. SHJSY1]